MVDPRHIRGFLAVVHYGNFARAASELHVSRSALTIHVQQLENSLGVKLLDRSKRTVVLSQAGHDLLVPLERILADLNSIMGTSRDLAEFRRGVITVATLPTIAVTILPRALGEFSQLYPGVSVKVIESLVDMVDLVKEGDADLGLGRMIQKDRSLQSEPLCVEPICLFAPKKHPLARKKSATLKELSEHQLIMPQKRSHLRVILERAFEEQGLTPRPLHETGHCSTTIAMVNAGLGVAVLPGRAMECFRSENIRRIELTEPSLERHIVIVSKSGRSFSPVVHKLIEILHGVVKKTNNGTRH